MAGPSSSHRVRVYSLWPPGLGERSGGYQIQGLRALIRLLPLLFFFQIPFWGQQYSISTLAGGVPPITPGAAAVASIGDPPRVAVDTVGNLYFGSVHSVFKVDNSGTFTRIAGSGRISKHASGEAIDFNAGGRKGAVVQWLIANHKTGGTMTYAGMDHIHVDIGPYFISLAGGRHVSSWRGGRSD